MELETLGWLLALEALVLLAALVVVLGRRQRTLRRQLEQLSKHKQAEPGFASVESGYLAFLETQIVESRARLELAQAETSADAGLLEALSNRLVLLESEKKVVELCNDYPARRWEHVRACFVPFIEPAEAADPAQGDEPDSAPHIGTLQTALSGQVNAIQSLQHLMLQARQEPDQTLIEQMEKHIAQLERQCREANTCVEIMEQENQRLQHRVEGAGLRADRAAADSRENAAELQQQLDKQKRTITELHERLDRLKQEAEQAQALRGQVEQLERTGRDMTMCVETLEEENEFLQEQIRALLHLDQSQTVYQADGSKEGAPEQDELQQLQEEIRARDEKLKALEEKYAAMEREYLTLYEEANAPPG